jgi:sugar-specific transcriptional regulator TrmB
MLKVLTELGLKKTEAKIYFYLSKRGPKQAHEIMKALKMKKQQLYPSIKSLQNKAIIESSLDRPARFSTIPFEKVLDLFARARMEEAKMIQQNKEKILTDWNSINLPSLKRSNVFFNVVKGKKYVYSKIHQMIQETTSQFSVISDLSELVRSEQLGVLDTIQSHPKKAVIQFRIITEVPKHFIRAVKKLSESINPKIELKGLNTRIGSPLVPRMVIRDDEEILYFVSERKGELGEQREYNCLFTNCNSIVKPLSNVFEDLWQNSTDIKQKIREIETGIIPQKTLVIKDIAEAQAKYNEVLRNAKKEILIVTSADELGDFQKTIPKIREQNSQNLSIRIMSPIVKENLEAANKILEHSQVKHIPQGYLDTVIIDGIHLFQFSNPPSIMNGVEKKQNFKTMFYTNDPEHVIKTKNMLENIWDNSSDPPTSPIESTVDRVHSFFISPNKEPSKPSSEIICDFMKTWPFIEISALGEITEKEVINKILKPNQGHSTVSSTKVIKCYSKSGFAALNPPDHFNLPKILIGPTQIDKKSSFGAEDRIVFYLWQKTKDGFNFVPVAIIGDNPNFPVETLKKGQYRNTPAEKNFYLFKREDIQFQIYGNTFLASWTKPVPLIPGKFVLSPGTIILESYGKARSARASARYPSGAKYEWYSNRFDAFVTFMQESSKYTGSGTDGLVFRDVYMQVSFP